MNLIWEPFFSPPWQLLLTDIPLKNHFDFVSFCKDSQISKTI